MTILKKEARLLRQAADAALAGASLTSIAKNWNARGIATSQNAVSGWSSTTVKQVLCGPHQAGLRRHRGEVIGNGQWPAIFTRGEHERLVAALSDPKARKPTRTSLLTSLVRCGACGETMTRATVSRGRPVWRCHRRPGYPQCGTVSTAAPPLEEIVTEAVLIALDGPELARLLSGASTDGEDDAATAELAKAEARLIELAEIFAAGEINRAEWMHARRSLDERRDCRPSPAASPRTVRCAGPLRRPGALRDAWPDLDEQRRRAVIAAVVDASPSLPRTRRGPGFDPHRIDINWRAAGECDVVFTASERLTSSRCRVSFETIGRAPQEGQRQRLVSGSLKLAPDSPGLNHGIGFSGM